MAIVNDNPYGVTVFNTGATLSTSINLPQLIQDMQALRLAWLRLDIHWNAIESPQGTYTWTATDAIIGRDKG